MRISEQQRHAILPFLNRRMTWGPPIQGPILRSGMLGEQVLGKLRSSIRHKVWSTVHFYWRMSNMFCKCASRGGHDSAITKVRILFEKKTQWSAYRNTCYSHELGKSFANRVFHKITRGIEVLLRYCNLMEYTVKLGKL